MKFTSLSRRDLLKTSAALGAAPLAMPGAAWAQGYPQKPITVVVPYAAGGTLDVTARWLQERLGRALGRPIVVDVKPGASGMVGTRHVAKSAADGYTLLMQTSAIVITPQISKNPGFSPLEDFEPISLVTSLPFVLITHPSLPARSVKELIDYAKKNPGKIDFGSSGASSFGRLATEQFMHQAGIKMTHVPYKGVAGIVQALYTGEVKVMLSSVTPQLTQMVADGKLNMLGVASLEPTPLVPGVEPIANTVKGFQAEVWYGYFAPRGTPRDVTAKVQQALATIVATPEFKAFTESIGGNPDATTGAALKAKLAREYKQWTEIVKATGVTED